MSTLRSFAFPLLALLLYYAFVLPKQTTLTFYVHDYLGGPDPSAITVAGRDGPAASPFRFGSIVAVDDAVTAGPGLESGEIGRAQGMYVNSQLDGRSIHLVFSVVFTGGEYKGSTLEIQGADDMAAEEREFSVVSGTGFFRFVKGYGVMTTAMVDVPNMRGVLKLDVTVKHY